MSKSIKPALVVVTPVRNEAWVLDAFLTCVSSWADYIVVADQHSTDGSREIAAKYEKVILVDNDAAEMNQAAARLLLFNEVDKIEGDKIVLALDADEFLSKGFDQTEGWKRILSSQPNGLFCFRWLNVYGNLKNVILDDRYMEWGCHFPSNVRISELYLQCEKRSVHEMRVPCLPSGEVSYVEIDDIQFVHLARLNLARQKNKEDFYQVSTVAKLKTNISAVSLFRSYHQPEPSFLTLEHEIELYAPGLEGSVAGLVKQDDYGMYYIDEMRAIFLRDGFAKYLKLDIWENRFLKEKGLCPKVPLRYRWLHSYLRKTQDRSQKKITKAIDKLLKLFC